MLLCPLNQISCTVSILSSNLLSLSVWRSMCRGYDLITTDVAIFVLLYQTEMLHELLRMQCLVVLLLSKAGLIGRVHGDAVLVSRCWMCRLHRKTHSRFMTYHLMVMLAGNAMRMISRVYIRLIDRQIGDVVRCCGLIWIELLFNQSDLGYRVSGLSLVLDHNGSPFHLSLWYFFFALWCCWYVLLSR